MKSRAASLRYPEGTTSVGTARVRDPRASRVAAMRAAATPRTAKYGNVKVEHDGIKFDSKREAKRYRELVAMQERGEIAELERQVVFVLAAAVVIGGRKRPALRYVADFVYERAGEERQTIEDVKGRITEGYRIKRHLMKAVHGLDIVEI
ncbi:DUF1064 domain-containing protein [Paraburkholderia tropica]|uniref:DUF1064 domain-containing protein n=1 Tax=Paraburkholderia tropica TaxID=92647 RepID=UPI0016017261|nr:DUF1064 domain-containing protein [Paraburkholderia tropica]QNB13456.1 DUF1064 domain-containing protein [Paraburkholderia tropica]